MLITYTLFGYKRLLNQSLISNYYTTSIMSTISTAETTFTAETNGNNRLYRSELVVPRNKPVVLNIKDEKNEMKKYIVLERYFGTKSRQTQFNCLGRGDNPVDITIPSTEYQDKDITLELLSLNESNNVVDRFGVYRDIYCMDAIQWLKENEISPNSSVITSLPDISEIKGLTYEQYKQWFTETVATITSKLSEKNVAIFYQTDIKRRWKANRGIIEEYIDKGYLAQKGAEQSGCKVVWHKIMTAHAYLSNNKSSFTHMLCFAKSPTSIVHQDNSPDISNRGSMVWSRAMGLNACVVAINYVRGIGSRTVIDPFCGKGSILAIGNLYGLNSIGVDLSTGKTRNSFNLSLDVDTVLNNKIDLTVWKQSHNSSSGNKEEEEEDKDEEENEQQINKK